MPRRARRSRPSCTASGTSPRARCGRRWRPPASPASTSTAITTTGFRSSRSTRPPIRRACTSPALPSRQRQVTGERLEPRRKRGHTTMAVAGICELVLETDDVGALAGFYRELGLRLLLEEDDRVWLAVGDRCRLGIWPPGEKEHGDGDGAEQGVMALAEDGDGA